MEVGIVFKKRRRRRMLDRLAITVQQNFTRSSLTFALSHYIVKLTLNQLLSAIIRSL
jgi:hypothetical protein